MYELKKHVRTEGIESKVQFLGAIPNEMVYEWLDLIDIFVLSCKVDSNGDQDGIPVVLMEAISSSTPVISTKISAIPELIDNSVSGLLAEPGNVDSLTEKIRIMLTNECDRKKYSKNAIKRLKEEFDLNVNAKRLKKIFEEMINERK